MIYGFCKQCRSEIASSRQSDVVLVCNYCGWTKKNNAIKKLIHRDFLRNIIVFNLILMGVLHQIRTWDTYFISVIPYQIKKELKHLTAEDALKLRQICKIRLNYECMEEASYLFVNLEPSNHEAIKLYAQSLRLNKKLDLALEQYKNYFLLGGTSVDVALEFAVLLGERGYIENSIKYYEYTLNSKPKVIQISVLKKYIKMLLKNKKFALAKQVILKTRRKTRSSRLVLEKELVLLKNRRKS